MSYIVRASWWRRDNKHWLIDKESDAIRDAEVLVKSASAFLDIYGGGTVTITKDGEVIREYKVGNDEA